MGKDLQKPLETPTQPSQGEESFSAFNLSYFDDMGYNYADPLYYPLLHQFAIENKKHQTEAELVLWHRLKAGQLGGKFNRQHIIGRYIVDFVCLDKKLVVEVDGAYHSQAEQAFWDEFRDEFLNSIGFKVLRFTNEEVLFDIDSVCSVIRKYINKELNEG